MMMSQLTDVAAHSHHSLQNERRAMPKEAGLAGTCNLADRSSRSTA
jgi:hypothetical protein